MSLFPDMIRNAIRAPRDDAGGTRRPTRDLDFGIPEDNLYAFAKLWSTLADEPILSSFHGRMFAVVDGRRTMPLFGYAGTGLFQSRLLDNGHVRLRGKETGFFTELGSGRVLSTWENPFTGETVEVYDFLNDRIRGELTTEMPSYRLGESQDEPTLLHEGAGRGADGAVPFLLPWEIFGDRVHLGWDYCHSYTNPVDKERWPRASTGPTINPSEHFYFTTSLRELEDRSNPSARYTAGFSRLSPWWPWMRMGESGVDGVLFGRMVSVKAAGRPEDVPRKIYEHVARHHPDYLEAPDDWDDGHPLSTWEAYARDIPPE